ncbi:hypothetical protein [Fibrella forsythiae]|uniref:T9SS C-terminal target domain-containing protein n=1 Tax=Fibrella forsythiae TaxID=2817061 RepID=A0ABS3JMI5_9BACT|nr:hypothetical protein [Fibrella forsythiae]MBO0951220.1 hypothetical protein [Fibrella forsythiae]
MAILTIRTSPVSNALPYQPQTAQNTMITTRNPKGWSVIDSRPWLWHGPVPAGPQEREQLFSHGGISHSVKPLLCNDMYLPSGRRAVFPGGQDMHSAALAAAGEMDDNDPRKSDLLTFGNGDITGRHYVNGNRQAWRALGNTLYRICVAANLGVPPALIGADMENQWEVSPGDGDIYMSGVYEGFRQAIYQLGHNCKLFTYGTGGLYRPVSYTANKQDGDICMRLPGTMWLGSNGQFDANNPNVQVFINNGAYTGGDQYARRTHDNQSVYAKTLQGAYILDQAGNPTFAIGGRMSSNYGQAHWIYRPEPRYFIEMFYELADRTLIEWRWRCNTPIGEYQGNFVNMPYPKGTYDLRPGLGGLKLASWIRNNTEIEQQYDYTTDSAEPFWSTQEKGIEAANQRPQNPDALEFQFLWRSVFYHLNVTFANEGNAYDWVNGQQGTARLDYNAVGGEANVAPVCAFGQFETMFLARYRMSMFPDFYALMDAGLIEFIIPKRFILDGNRAFGEREFDKPIKWLLKERGGRRLWIIGVYPILDTTGQHSTAQTHFWVDGNDGVSGTYTINWVGRSTFWAQMALPEGCQNIRPEDIFFEHTNPLGQTFQYTGNYNVPVSGFKQKPAFMPTGQAINLVIGGSTSSPNSPGGVA